MTPLAIYDLDETITRRPTFARWLLFWAARRAPLRLPLLSVQGLATLAYVGGLLDRRRLKMLGIDLLMRGASRALVESQARAFVARELRLNVLPGALAAIATDRAAGRRLVMATASMDFYAFEFARALGFEAAIATRSGSGSRLNTGAVGPNCYAEEKLCRVELWIAEAGIARGDAHVRFYSDHISDSPTLAWADEAVVVNPAPPLERIAAGLGWRIARWG